MPTAKPAVCQVSGPPRSACVVRVRSRACPFARLYADSMERYEATIPIEEQILSVIDQGPAIGADIRPDGSRFSWIDEGFNFGSQGVHLATED